MKNGSASWHPVLHFGGMKPAFYGGRVIVNKYVACMYIAASQPRDKVNKLSEKENKQ